MRHWITSFQLLTTSAIYEVFADLGRSDFHRDGSGMAAAGDVEQ
jgi:hypothetical protein